MKFIAASVSVLQHWKKLSILFKFIFGVIQVNVNIEIHQAFALIPAMH